MLELGDELDVSSMPFRPEPLKPKRSNPGPECDDRVLGLREWGDPGSWIAFGGLNRRKITAGASHHWFVRRSAAGIAAQADTARVAGIAANQARGVRGERR